MIDLQKKPTKMIDLQKKPYVERELVACLQWATRFAEGSRDTDRQFHPGKGLDNPGFNTWIDRCKTSLVAAIGNTVSDYLSDYPMVRYNLCDVCGCDITATMLDSRGCGPAEQDPETGKWTCSEGCREGDDET